MDLKSVRDMAFTNLQNVTRDNESFMPVTFLNGEREAVIGCPFSDQTKLMVMQQVGAMAHKLIAKEIYVVTDAYVRTVNKDDLKWVQENWEIERPSTYPKEMRVDCLVITKIVPGNPVENKVLTIVYEVKNKEVIIKQEDVLEEFDGTIKDAVLFGYNSGQEPVGFRPI